MKMDLLALIRGDNPSLEKGLYTYPKATDENQKLLHTECIELEKRKLVYRKIDDPNYILWFEVEKDVE